MRHMKKVVFYLTIVYSVYIDIHTITLRGRNEWVFLICCGLILSSLF